jgi:hypothetical protein
MVDLRNPIHSKIDVNSITTKTNINVDMIDFIFTFQGLLNQQISEEELEGHWRMTTKFCTPFRKHSNHVDRELQENNIFSN